MHILYAGNLLNFLNLDLYCETGFLSSEGLPGVALLLWTMTQYSSLSYATRVPFLRCNLILAPSCVGVKSCTFKFFMGRVISSFERMARDHAEFVCRMKEYLPRSDFFKKTLKALETHFTMKPVNLDAVGENDGEEMPPSTRLLSQQELEDGSQCPLESVAG
uniref:Uncharacterized protein LOC103931360 isoform X3 n=1 Tax=Rhizophora mucronata TaxID=61149 RepID=A0A2P2KDZ2_RHIMU